MESTWQPKIPITDNTPDIYPGNPHEHVLTQPATWVRSLMIFQTSEMTRPQSEV
ncbi:mCG1044322 [Mus musculus]|nr:mCG1044322 [Mus musculus]